MSTQRSQSSRAVKHEYQFPAATLRSYSDGTVREFAKDLPRAGVVRSRFEAAMALMALRAARRGGLGRFLSQLEALAPELDAIAPGG